MAKNNLIILANPFVNNKGLAGGDLFYIELSRYLNKKFNVSVIIPGFAKVHWKETKVKLLPLKKNAFDLSEKRVFIFFAYLIRSFQTYSVIKSFSPNTIFCSSSDFLPDVLPIFLAKSKGVRYFWVARFYHLITTSNKNVSKFQNYISYFLQKLSIFMATKRADLILVDNQKTLNFFKKNHVPQSKLLLTGGSINYKKLAKYRTQKQKTYDCIFVGRLDYNKGVFDLPKIWAIVTKQIPTAKLAIVGTATHHNVSKLKNLITVNNIENNIDLLGFLPHSGSNTIFKTYSNSKIFLSLTLEGGRDFALIEAMACNLPVIAYNQPFLKEGTINNGFITAPRNDKTKLASLIVKLLKNPSKRSIMAKKACQEVEKLDWSKTYQTLIGPFSALRQLTPRNDK